jgi:hypothetical protein
VPPKRPPYAEEDEADEDGFLPARIIYGPDELRELQKQLRELPRAQRPIRYRPDTLEVFAWMETLSEAERAGPKLADRYLAESGKNKSRRQVERSIEAWNKRRSKPTPADGLQYTRTTDLAGVSGRTVSAAAGVIISDTAPLNPIHGALWWRSNTGKLYVFYNDGTSSQWVQVGP